MRPRQLSLALGLLGYLLCSACGDRGSVPGFDASDHGGGPGDSGGPGPGDDTPSNPDVPDRPDGGGTPDVPTPCDACAQPDAPPSDTPPGTDGQGPDTPQTDTPPNDTPGLGDTPQGDAEITPPPPPPPDFAVISAFSADGDTITVRFNRDVDPTSGSTAANFTIYESAQPKDFVQSASVDGLFVRLTLKSQAVIDQAYTYSVLVDNVADLDGEVVKAPNNRATIKRSVYLNLVWHQHQPLYLDPVLDELQGPWVRKHAAKSYYDMSAILREYPNVHMTVNLTVVLLRQMMVYYLDRLGPYVDPVANTVDEAAFLARWRGHTDPWIDLLLDDTPTPATASEKQLGLLYQYPWSCVSTNENVLNRWPEYLEVRTKNPALLDQQDFLKLKVFFELAWIDPDFIEGRVELPNGWVIDLSDVVRKDGEGRYWLRSAPTEALANRLVAEQYKIMANVVPIHQEMRYDAALHTGQIEVSTTPFYHPILPLVYNTNLAAEGLPGVPLPNPPYAYANDAEAHVVRAVRFYEELFDEPPRGMWLGEGSVAQDIVHILVKPGIELLWTATDKDVLLASEPGGQAPYFPYRIDGHTTDPDNPASNPAGQMVIVFRDTALSNKVGFTFGSLTASQAVGEFLNDVLAQAPRFGGDDRLISVILDGENAWEGFRYEYDGKGFLHGLYAALDASSRQGEIVPVTPSEYVLGNPERGIPPHPVAQQPGLTRLRAGSWIGGTFDTWIGEGEENLAWRYLAQARHDLEMSALPRPNPIMPEPAADPDDYLWNVWKAWDEIYAAEGSDWFWWYGGDMTSPSNDDSPFDAAFRSHLEGMYEFMNAALVLDGRDPMNVPVFAPIVQAKPKSPDGPFEVAPAIDGEFAPDETEWTEVGGYFFDQDSTGVMASATDDIGTVYFGFDADKVYLALKFNEDVHAKLGTPYTVALYLSQKHILDPDEGLFTELPANHLTRNGYAIEFADSGATWEVLLDFGGATLAAGLNRADGAEHWTPVAGHDLEVGGPRPNYKIVELAIPWADLGMQADLARDPILVDPLEILVVASEGTTDIDIAPNVMGQKLFEDVTSLVYLTFECDVSGSVVPIDTYVELCTPPPPAGNGIVYIAGNQASLGQQTTTEGVEWVPNKIPLIDNGETPDEAAGDRKWTSTFTFPRGTLLRWKYTIGLPRNEGHWECTEEYPMTERGLTVPMNPQLFKMVLHEAFADRPQPTGTLAPNTRLECFDKQLQSIDCD